MITEMCGFAEHLARIGYDTDTPEGAAERMSNNVLRTVAEERLVLCVTRPPAILAISNLPAATTTTRDEPKKAPAKSSSTKAS